VSIDFTYQAYEALLRFIREDLGRPIVALREVPDQDPCVILRHDIDFSLEKALHIAEIDQKVGARATVFVLMTCEYYNLLRPENIEAVRRIASMGHEIGLHYEIAAAPGVGPEAKAQDVVRLARFLEEYAGVPISSVAQHNPSMTEARLSIAGYRDAYDPRFFKQIGYLSDSRRLFGAPDVYQFFRDHPRSQFLAHPLWWHEDEQSRRQSFDNIVQGIVRLVTTRVDEENAVMEEDERRLRARGRAADG
jgi:hypothetical protein